MKSFLEMLKEYEQNDIEINNNLSSMPPSIKDDMLNKSMDVFQYLIRKYPSDCMDFIYKYVSKDQFVKSEVESMKKLADTYKGNSQQYGLAYLKGNYPKTGLNN